jgi:hypothetical protein
VNVNVDIETRLTNPGAHARKNYLAAVNTVASVSTGGA